MLHLELPRSCKFLVLCRLFCLPSGVADGHLGHTYLLGVHFTLFTTGQVGTPLAPLGGGMTRASRGLLCSSKREHGGGGVRRDPNGVRASEGASPHACPEPRLTRTPPDQNLDRAARGEWGGGGGLGGHGVWTHLAPRCSAMPPPPSEGVAGRSRGEVTNKTPTDPRLACRLHCTWAWTAQGGGDRY